VFQRAAAIVIITLVLTAAYVFIVVAGYETTFSRDTIDGVAIGMSRRAVIETLKAEGVQEAASAHMPIPWEILLASQILQVSTSQ